MKGYVFTFGYDDFGEDVAPAHEEGIYLNFDKAFKRLCELNSKMLNSKKKSPFFEKGYSEDYYPDNDIELKQAEETKNWELFDTLLNKHRITDIEKICSMYCVNKKPYFEFYAIEEIEIFE